WKRTIPTFEILQHWPRKHKLNVMSPSPKLSHSKNELASPLLERERGGHPDKLSRQPQPRSETLAVTPGDFSGTHANTSDVYPFFCNSSRFHERCFNLR